MDLELEPAGQHLTLGAIGTRILRGAFGGFVLNVLTYGFLFIGQILIARILPREEYANFTVAISFVSIMSLFADLGMNSMFTRIFAEAEEHTSNGAKDRRGVLFGTALVLRFIGSAIVSLLVLIIAPRIYGPETYNSMFILLITLIISSRLLILRSVGDSLIRSQGRYYLSAGFACIDAVFFATIMVIGNKMTLHSIVWAYTACNIPGFLLMSFVIIRWVTKSNIHVAVDWKVLKEMLRVAIPLAFGTAFLTIHNEADKLLLDRLSTPMEVSAYGATIRLLSAAAPLPLVLAAVTAPEVTKLLLRGDLDRCHSLINLSLRILLMIAGGIAVVVTASHHDLIVLLLGDKYASAAPLLMISSWMLLPIFLAWFTTEISIAAGQFRPWTIYNAIIMTVVIAGDLVLIPSMGAAGAMFSKLIAITCGCAALFYIQRDATFLTIRTSFFILLKTILSIAVALVVYALIRNMLGMEWMISIIVLFVFLLMIHLTKIVEFREARALVRRLVFSS